MRSKISFIILLCLTTIPLFGQYPKVFLNPVQRKLNLSVNEGLPSSETYFVHQDKKGFIWICTDRGVARYDGFKMDVFTTKNGLPDNVIFYLVEDDFDRLWFVSNSGKLSYFKNGKIYLYKYNDKVSKAFGVQHRPIKKFHVDKKGNIYYSNVYSSILKVSPSGKITKLRNAGAHTTIYRFDNTFFNLYGISSSLDEIIVFNAANQKVKVKSSLNGLNMLTDQIRVGGREFIRLKNEVIEITPTMSNKREFKQITGLFKIHDKLAVCTIDGVHLFDKSNDYNLKKVAPIYLMKGNKISHIIQDNEGGMWMSTLDNGVYYMPNPKIINYSVGNGLGENKIYDIFTVKNQIYFSNQRGYFNFNKREQIQENDELSSSLGFEYGGKVVLHSNTFINGYRRATGNRILTSEFESYCKGKNNTILISGFRLYRLNSKLEFEQLYWFNPHRKKSGNIHVDCIGEDFSNDIIYAGNNGGLYYLKGDKFIQDGIPEVLKNIRISALLYEPKVGLWVGTRGDGIFLLQKNKIVKHINHENGLIDNQVNSIAPGQDHVIWVSSNSGLSKINYYSTSLVRIQNITNLIGISTSEINRVVEHKDSVFLATKKGICIIPKNVSDFYTSNSSQIWIKRVLVNNIKVPLNQNNLTVDGDANMINVEFFSSNFRTTFHKKYKYRLSQTDDWIYGSTGLVNLINLEPGTYDLQLSYQNEFGIWVKPYKLITIVKNPKFVESRGFTLLIMIVIIFIIVGAVVYRVQLLRKRLRQKALIEQLEQKSLIAQINPHFIFNSLNSIQSFLVYNENEKAERFLIKLAKLIRSTLSVSRENKISIEMEKQLLIEYLELEKMRFKDKFDYQIISSLTTTEEKFIIPPMLIQPFVENSVLHGFIHKLDHGRIRIEFIEIVNNVLSISIIDNGVGRSKAEHKKSSEHKSFATDITRERLETFQKKYKENFYFEIIDLMNGDEPAGTEVRLKLPVLGKS